MQDYPTCLKFRGAAILEVYSESDPQPRHAVKKTTRQIDLGEGNTTDITFTHSICQSLQREQKELHSAPSYMGRFCHNKGIFIFQLLFFFFVLCDAFTEKKNPKLYPVNVILKGVVRAVSYCCRVGAHDEHSLNVQICIHVCLCTVYYETFEKSKCTAAI